MIEGEVFFDRVSDAQKRSEMAKEREALEKLDVNKAPGSGGTPPRVPAERRRGERDEAEFVVDGGHR